MFDDPKKELRALEGQLLAAEERQEAAMLDEKEFETLYNEIRAEFAPRNEPPVRNYANGYGRACAPAPRAAAPAPAPAPAPKRRGNKGLGFILFLEFVSIIAVLGFWALHLLGDLPWNL